MSQIFKKVINNEILFDFLDKICEKTDKYYIFNLESYKRGEMDSHIELFLEGLKSYYYRSKLFYLERKRSYTSICTIIRQICKGNSVMFTTKIIYSKSKYNIPYYIYF